MKRSPDHHDVVVGQRLKTQRLAIGMSQTKLASEIGLSFQQVQKYEKGTNKIGAGRLIRIAQILGVPVSYFFDYSQSTAPAGAHLFDLLSTVRAERLLRAFSRVKQVSVQKAIVDLVEIIAAEKRSRQVSHSSRHKR